MVRKLYPYQDLFPIKGGIVLDTELMLPVALRIHRDVETMDAHPPLLKITITVRVPLHKQTGIPPQDVLLKSEMKVTSAMPTLDRLGILEKCVWEIIWTDPLSNFEDEDGNIEFGDPPYIPPEPGYEFVVEDYEKSLNPKWEPTPDMESPYYGAVGEETLEGNDDDDDSYPPEEDEFVPEDYPD
jgi:hypothetical protein